MARRIPYLQCRQTSPGTYFFRHAIPRARYMDFGCREITRTLRTSDRRIAEARALELAARVKRLFAWAAEAAGTMDQKSLKEILQQKKHELQIDQLKERYEDELIEQRCAHRRALEHERLKVRSELLDSLLANGIGIGAVGAAATIPTAAAALTPTASAPVVATSVAPSPVAPAVVAPASPGPAPIPLSGVVGDFLATYNGDKKGAMLKKHKSVLPVLVEIVGDKAISDIRQGDVTRFFQQVQKLPPRWSDELRRRGCSLSDLLAEVHPVMMSPKTFDDTYKASVRAFLTWAKAHWQDQGFPTTLTTDGLEYRGDREEGSHHQRAMKLPELKRLFEGDEMRAFAESPGNAHRYWLPHLGLFTGARINELCQINPQTDVLSEDGVWCLWLTDETEGDGSIRKSVKTPGSKRTVPIHPRLIELGFLKYVEHVKASGAKLLFPAWTPEGGRACPKAEKWFGRHLRKLGLRDDTPGARLVGFHFFRSTILTNADRQGIEGIIAITGHADQGKSAVVRRYTDAKVLPDKLAILTASLAAITPEIAFIPPVAPSRTARAA